MVVLAASIINKSGKVLVSRQFVNVSRTLIEGYLGDFRKLVGTGKQQHKFVETENVRYVYQSLESLYLILVTDKHSNIFHDLETLSLLYKLVTELALSLDEEGVGLAAFDFIFAFDQVILLGRKEDVTFKQVLQCFEMQSDQERLHKMVMQSKIDEAKGVMKNKAIEIDNTDSWESECNPVTFIFEEKLNITFKLNGCIANYDVKGSLSLQLNQDGHIQVKIKVRGDNNVQFETHPSISKELFYRKNILVSKDPNMPIPTGSDGVSLLKWTTSITDRSLVPLKLECYHSVSGNEANVYMRYEASKLIGLHNVFISIPFPVLRNAPKVEFVHGEWRYDSGKSILEWSITIVKKEDRTGYLSYIIPATDMSQCYPVSVCFIYSCKLTDLEVVKVLPLRGGNPPKFSEEVYLSTENYLCPCVPVMESNEE